MLPTLALLVPGCQVLPSLPGKAPPPAPELVVTPPRPTIAHPGAQPASPVGPDEAPLAMTAENCDDLKDGGPVQGPDCVTAEVKCGQVVFGHTFGGTNVFSSKFYEKQACTPATTNHDGSGERAYLLRMPEGEHHVALYLDTPCADLDLAAMRVNDPTKCPGLESFVATCDMWPKPGNKREKVELSVQGATDFLLVVEGKKGQDGGFALTIQCGEGLY